MPKVKYKYDAGLYASFDNLNESYDFEQNCSMKGLFVSYLQNTDTDIRIWFKPEKWLKTYFGFSDKQLKAVLMLSKIRWTHDGLPIKVLLKNYDCKFNKKQRRFLNKMIMSNSEINEKVSINFNLNKD